MTPQSIAPPGEVTDADLIARVQRSDEAAFAELMRRHVPAVRAFIAMKLPVGELADDLTHETFVFAFRNLTNFELVTSFRAWLRAVAWNLVRREVLRFARERQNLSRLEQMQLLEVAGEAEGTPRDEAVYLEECLDRLPDAMRRLVEERYHAGRTNEEIAVAWQRTSEWVRVTLMRVRRQLRECIENKIVGSCR